MTADRRKLTPVLNQAGHIYTLDGKPLAGVTTVIHAVHRAPELEEWFKRTPAAEADRIRDEAAAFGNSVHAALAAYLTGAALIPLPREERWQRTVEAGIAWLEANVEEVLAVEEPVASAIYGYAGKPDLYAVLRRARRQRSTGRLVPTVIDFKTTGAIYWPHLFQLAAYRQAAKETYDAPPPDRLALRLDKDEPGRVEPRPLPHHDRDWAGFGYCLGMFRILEGGMA
jgi:hypothetical protein